MKTNCCTTKIPNAGSLSFFISLWNIIGYQLHLLKSCRNARASSQRTFAHWGCIMLYIIKLHNSASVLQIPAVRGSLKIPQPLCVLSMQQSLSSANRVRLLFLPCPALSIRGRDTQKTEEGLSVPQERFASNRSTDKAGGIWTQSSLVAFLLILVSLSRC